MKKLVAFLLALCMCFCIIPGNLGLGFTEMPATPTDLDPVVTDPITDPPGKIQVTKILHGEIWSLRCDVMDNTDFTAGGGYWYPDITNHQHETGKEGHRSNHCGNRENWVLFVNEDGQATGLYQLKSGSTGGTLPSIMYRAPSDLATIPEGQFYYDPTIPDDPMTARLLNEIFIPSNVISFADVPLVEGTRLFWISQNGKQVWHHTGVLKKTTPRFAFIINGEPYTIGVGETITIDEVEEGMLEIEEIATANYKLEAIQQNENGDYIVINEIDDPGRPTPTPPPAITNPPATSPPPDVTNTPTPSPTPTPTPSPTPNQEITVHKIWDDDGDAASARPAYVVIKLYANNALVDTVHVQKSELDTNEAVWTYTFENLPVYDETGDEIKYSIEEKEVDGYEVHYRGTNVFNVYITPTPSPTPSPSSTPSPTPSPSPTPTATATATVTVTVTVTPSPTPTATATTTVTESPSPTPTATATATTIVTESPSPTPTATATTTITPSPTPTATVTVTATVTESPSPTPSASPTPTVTITVTISPSPSPTPTATPIEVITDEPTASPTPTATATATTTVTETPTSTPTATPEETETATPEPDPTPTATVTATVVVTDTPAPTPTEIPLGGIRLIKQTLLNGTPTDLDADYLFRFLITGPNDYSREIELVVREGGEAYIDIEDLVPGEYTIVETRMPNGFVLWTFKTTDETTEKVKHGIIITVEPGVAAKDNKVIFKNNKEEPTPTPEPEATPTPTPVPPLNVLVHYINVQGETLLDDYTEVVPYGTMWMLKIPSIKGYRYISRLDTVYVLFEDLELTLVYDKPKPIDPLTFLDDYATALGINVPINHVGDCFD